MICGAKLIGNEFLNVELVKKFREMYQQLQKVDNPEQGFDIQQNYFYLSKRLAFQFDGFFCLYVDLKLNKQSEISKIDNFEEFVETKCIPLAFASNLITFILNHPVIDGEVVKIIDMPYDNLFDENFVKDDSKLKECFASLLKTNVNTLFSLIKDLQKTFFESNLYNNYVNAQKTDGNIKKYQINIQAFFYLIKQIIYQEILDGLISYINDDNIISFKRSNSIEGNSFEIKYQPSNNLNFSTTTGILEIIYEGKKELAKVSFSNISISQEKGSIINIKGEILSKEGLNTNSPINNYINENYKKFGHWYKFIDETYEAGI